VNVCLTKKQKVETISNIIRKQLKKTKKKYLNEEDDDKEGEEITQNE
jgi:hypothetical protein